MKLISIAILFICVFAASFSNLLIIAAYNANQQYVASEFCVNKNNASMECNGHCYLSKQLANQEKPSSPLNAKSNEKFEVQLFCITLPENNPCLFQSKNVNVHKNQNFTAQQFINTSFHPPQA